MSINKPIHLKYFYDGTNVKFEIKDCGTRFENIIIDEQIETKNLLSDGGRGLFLIKNLSNKIELRENTLIVHKCLCI